MCQVYDNFRFSLEEIETIENLEYLSDPAKKITYRRRAIACVHGVHNMLI